jgi:hypothetical protein
MQRAPLLHRLLKRAFYLVLLVRSRAIDPLCMVAFRNGNHRFFIYIKFMVYICGLST